MTDSAESLAGDDCARWGRRLARGRGSGWGLVVLIGFGEDSKTSYASRLLIDFHFKCETMK